MRPLLGASEAKSCVPNWGKCLYGCRHVARTGVGAIGPSRARGGSGEWRVREAARGAQASGRERRPRSVSRRRHRDACQRGRYRFHLGADHVTLVTLPCWPVCGGPAWKPLTLSPLRLQRRAPWGTQTGWTARVLAGRRGCGECAPRSEWAVPPLHVPQGWIASVRRSLWHDTQLKCCSTASQQDVA